MAARVARKGFQQRSDPGLHRTQRGGQDVGAAPRVPPAWRPASRRGAAELPPLRLGALMALISDQGYKKHQSASLFPLSRLRARSPSTKCGGDGGGDAADLTNLFPAHEPLPCPGRGCRRRSQATGRRPEGGPIGWTAGGPGGLGYGRRTMWVFTQLASAFFEQRRPATAAIMVTTSSS